MHTYTFPLKTPTAVWSMTLQKPIHYFNIIFNLSRKLLNYLYIFSSINLNKMGASENKGHQKNIFCSR